MQTYQEAGTRAIEADEQQRQADAVKLYRTALQVIAEGLALNVPSTGLSAKADNIANWKQQLGTWQSSIQERYDAAAFLLTGQAAALLGAFISNAAMSWVLQEKSY